MDIDTDTTTYTDTYTYTNDRYICFDSYQTESTLIYLFGVMSNRYQTNNWSQIKLNHNILGIIAD